MNLNVVYELRNRLEMAVIAGANLVPEDFRLKRAVEQTEPLAAASPVFKKIYGRAKGLLEPDCEDRAGALLDTLSLVDAVLCTQGALQNGGEMQPLKGETREQESRDPAAATGEFLMENIPYSVMAPVIDAFCGTGGGRYAVLRDAHKEKPELFDDYRLKYRMVQALGDSYADIADMTKEWLKQMGPGLLPLLKEGFCPGGKKEMARRVEVIEAVAGDGENPFYRSLLLETEEKASREVREAAIRALRFSEENVPLLLELLKKEKGKLREAALSALSWMEGGKVKEFWEKLAEEKPVETAGYLKNSKAEWAADLIAGLTAQQVRLYHEERQGEGKKNKEQLEERRQSILNIWEAAAGKSSEALCQCYELMYGVSRDETVKVMAESLIRNPSPGLCQQTEKMFGTCGTLLLEPFAVMLLMTRSKEEAYERLEKYLKPPEEKAISEKFLSGKNLQKGDSQETEGLLYALGRISYLEEEGVYQIAYERPSREGNRVYEGRSAGRRLEAGLDLRWYPLLMENRERWSARWQTPWGEYRNFYDAAAARLYRPDRAELQPLYGRYFYEAAIKRQPTAEGIALMKRCGWTDYRGLFTSAVEQMGGKLKIFQLQELLKELPVGNQELAEELDALLEKNKKHALSGIGILEKWRENLRNGARVEELGR